MEGGIAIEVVFGRGFFGFCFLFFKNFITFIHNLFSNCLCWCTFEKKKPNKPCIRVCLCEYEHVHACRYPWRSEVNVKFPEVKVTGSCQSPNMGAGN